MLPNTYCSKINFNNMPFRNNDLIAMPKCKNDLICVSS